MSITGIASALFTSASALTRAVQSQPTPVNADPDGDGGTRKAHRHGHGHGQMQAALMQALQSLGLAAPTAATSSTASTTGTTASTTNSSATAVSGATSDDDSGGSSAGASSVKKDLRQFMHALFQAVKNDAAASGSTATGGTSGTSATSDPKSNFASGLSTLITQVSNGQAPSDLQNAFSQVVADMQPTTSASSSNAGGSGSGTSPQATLQALLTQLQQNLGYGSTSSTASIGNFLSQHA